MWISINQDWNESHSDLSKYFIEKLKQQVDSTEIISNKHRTTNGLTLISEIIIIAEMTKDRPKYKNRLISVLQESKDHYLRSNIFNDCIISRYFKDIKDYYSSLDPRNVVSKEREIKSLIIKSKIFQSRVEEKYYEYILNEVNLIDFCTDKFEREARKIDSVISCFTPYVLYLGYSTTSISEIAYRYIFKPHGTSAPKKIIKHFNGKKNEFKFLIKTQENAPEFSFIRENLNKNQVAIKKIKYDKVKKLMYEDIDISEGDGLFELSSSVIDPHNFLRLLYDLGLKWYVAKSARLSLNYFTPFFNNVYWRFGKTTSGNNHKYQNSKILLDPINVPERPDTLHATLKKLSKDFKFEKEIKNGIPAYSNLLQPIYFYNLALGSKSIENSISLLWTSLEMLVPYRPYEYDIENIQYFVSKSLAIGSIGRELSSLMLRYVETNKINNKKLSTDSFNTQYVRFTPAGLKRWAKWLTTDFTDDKDDPYNKIKDYSNLLCSQFCFMNNLYSGKSESAQYWIDRITTSEQSIKYQLDRIYLHRNQIVHTGKFINEYSNLWSHLEWYVGKLLSYCILQSINGEVNLQKMFLKLHSKNEQIISILKINKDKKINEMDFLFDDIFEPTWQMF